MRYKRNVACSLFRVALAGLAFFTASASADGQAAEETIKVSRIQMGLFTAESPNFDVTVSPEGEVVLRRHSYTRNFERSEHVDRYRVSPAEAARFRAALVRHRPEQSPTLVCQERVYGPNHLPMVRMAVFNIEWSGAATSEALGVCYTAQEQAIIDAIQQALGALHLKLDGSRF